MGKRGSLPTVAELADHYKVSGSTAAKVMRRLESDGLLRIVARWGSFAV